MEFILALIFFIIIFRLFFSWSIKRFIRKSTRQFGEERDEQPQSGPKKKKKIGKDRGDYVDFEEIE